MSSSRRSWGMKSDIDSDGKENAAQQHEEYLLLLQQRNRLLAKLQEKDEKQLELEKREQGFSLYLNGANVGLHVSGQRRSRQSKTAGERLKREIYKSEMTGMSSMASRAKTAPTKTNRKRWYHTPVEEIKIKTEKGGKLKVGLPGVYSGKYSEDFETYESYLESKSFGGHGEQESYSEMHDDDHDSDDDDPDDDDDDDDDVDDDSLIMSEDDLDVSEDVIDHELTFTVQDVKVLRASLENDTTIRQSIASISDDLPNISEDEISSAGFDEPDIPEELQHDIDNNADDDDDISLIDNCENLPELTGETPKPRPISATRKHADLVTVDPIVSENISAAIAEENKMLADYQQRRRTKTAPMPQLPAHTEAAEDIKDRPVTISSNLTDKEILSITERVRCLTGRQQKRLLKMLGEIDLAEDDILNESWDNRKDKNKQYLEEEKNNRQSTVCSSNVTANIGSINSDRRDDEKYEFDNNMNLKLSSNTDISSDDSEVQTLSPHDMRESVINRGSRCVEIVLELLSNWGNENYIGLTEIQFFNCTNKHIKVLPDDLSIIGTSGSVENLKNLSNSKTKTTKEKYMWKCRYAPDGNVKIIVRLQGCELANLGKIVIWNFNKNLQELNIGGKDCNVYINGVLKWTGVVEKGCGNQIFDYSTTVQINSQPCKPVTSAEDFSLCDKILVDTNTISNENEASADSVIVPSKVIDLSEPKVINLSESKVTNLMESKVINLSECKLINLSDDLNIIKPNVCNSPDLRKQKQKKVSPTTVPVGNKSKKARDSQASRSSSSMSDKPIWLEDSSKVKELKDNSDLFLEGKKVSLSRPASVRRSYQSTPDFIDEAVKDRRPTSGRRSQQTSTPDISTDLKSKKEAEDLFDLDSMPRKVGAYRRDLDLKNKNENKNVSVLPRRRGPLLIDMPSVSGDAVQRSERTKFKETMDENLEQSLQSINNFNFHHLGRITSRIDDESDELMSLLQPMKAEDVMMLQEESISPDSLQISDVLFEFPVLPKGKDLIINIKSTWGDRHYVGLNGIEVFSKCGNLVKVNSIQADPSDINMLPEFDGDPRVVTNLIDGCYLTRDDLHLWLTPFTACGDHFLELEFEDEVEIAMIRIWNYNKSRIHSTRGARFVEMALNGKLIFIGEIARASGILSNEDPYGDTILFTTDEDILTLVATNDFTYEVDMDEDEDYLMTSGIFDQRPKTADKPADQSNDRPFTCPKSRQQNERIIESPSVERILSPGDGFMHCKVLTIFFCETWADQHYLGLTGLEVLGETFEKIPLEMRMLEAFPEDLNVLEEYNDDDRTLDKIINGTNVTTSDENMWMIPFDEEGTHILKVSFDDYTIVTGLRVWNYNKSLEDTFRGAKTIHVYLDDHIISPQNGFLLRKGPGHCHFDFAQDILFNNPDSPADLQYPEASKHRKINLQKIVNEYETIMMPSGFVFQFKLFSSWGDQYYIGLNSIEVYDKSGDKIKLSDNNITAYPHSVNILEGVDDDVRTPDKLVNNINDTYDGRQMWLAPILPGQVNIVYIVFDEPITISMIKIWNYYKTPTRGVRNFGLLVDDLLVYSGVLPQHDSHARSIVPGIQPPGTHHTILFSDNEEIALRERKHLLSSSVSLSEQNVQLTNDRAIINPFKNEKEAAVEADPSMRPMTSVTSMRTKERR